jgi:hypothetical protein
MAHTNQAVKLIGGELRSTISLFLLDMANIMILTSDAGNPEGSSAPNQPEGGSSPQQSEGGLSDMEVSVTDLMAPEKRKTLEFGPSQVTQSLIDFYVSKGYFEVGVCRPPSAEVTPTPEDGEVVVFKDFFVAGMRFPLDPILSGLLLPFNARFIT